LVDGKVPDRFPGLRVGFIEFGSAWLPHIFPFISCKKSLEELGFWVTCEVREDIGYIVSKVGDERLMVGSDYTHGDRASVRGAHQLILERTDITSANALRITTTNAREFYGIS
jgi:hypothetical protein